jgi:hypothetical protein
VLPLAASQAQRARYGAAARARAEREFSLAEMVRRYGSLYERELALRMPRRAPHDARAQGAAVE